MMQNPEFRRLASRTAANLVAVVAVSAIFGLKAYIDLNMPGHATARPASEIALASGLSSHGD